MLRTIKIPRPCNNLSESLRFNEFQCIYVYHLKLILNATVWYRLEYLFGIFVLSRSWNNTLGIIMSVCMVILNLRLTMYSFLWFGGISQSEKFLKYTKNSWQNRIGLDLIDFTVIIQHYVSENILYHIKHMNYKMLLENQDGVF